MQKPPRASANKNIRLPIEQTKKSSTPSTPATPTLNIVTTATINTPAFSGNTNNTGNNTGNNVHQQLTPTTPCTSAQNQNEVPNTLELFDPVPKNHVNNISSSRYSSGFNDSSDKFDCPNAPWVPFTSSKSANIKTSTSQQSNNPSESSKFTYSSNLDSSSNPGRSSLAPETSSSNVACYNNPNSIGYSSILTSNFGQSSLASNPRTFEEFRRSSVSVGYVSVSDLCGTDEIEFLLDDIRDLVEPASCRPEDIQDFEIAGSRTGAVSVELSLLESPLGAPLSVHSWDSHAHYRQCAPPRILSPLHGVPLYCDKNKFKSPAVLLKILLFITSLACLVTLCSSGTVQVGLFLLPLLGRIRLMMFITLFSILVTGLILFLDITHIIILFPFNWNKINTYLYLFVGLMFIIGSSLLIHTVFFAADFSWVPRHSKNHIFATAMLGYLCCIEALSVTQVTRCTSPYSAVPEDISELCLNDGNGDPQSIMTSPPAKPICYQHHSFQPPQTSFSSNYNHTSRSIPGPMRSNKIPHSTSYQGCEYQPVASTSRNCPKWLPVSREEPEPRPGPSNHVQDTNQDGPMFLSNLYNINFEVVMAKPPGITSRLDDTRKVEKVD